jgi:peptidoglycan hydrolase CwlO-like protein
MKKIIFSLILTSAILFSFNSLAISLDDIIKPNQQGGVDVGQNISDELLGQFKELEDITKEIDKITGEVKNVEKSINNVDKNISGVLTKITSEVNKATGEIKGVSGEIKSIGEEIKKAKGYIVNICLLKCKICTKT